MSDGVLCPVRHTGVFFSELTAGESQLHRELHYLAYHYHWSEKEILSMDRDRRRKYIAILADEIERLNDGQP